MSTTRFISKFALIPLVGVVTYAAAVHSQVSGVPSSNILFKGSTPAAFRNSKTLQLVNPRQLKANGDTYSTEIEIPDGSRDVSDEVLLAWYLKGFFGSRVFAPERLVLRAFRPTGFTGFSGLPSSEYEKYIWAMKDIDEQAMPPLHTKIFGIFQVLGVELPASTNTGARESVVDIGFGSDTARFSGFHRLSIERTSTSAHLHLACTSCNPTSDTPLNSGILRSFHTVYAMLLFRAAVAHVKERLDTVQ